MRGLFGELRGIVSAPLTSGSMRSISASPPRDRPLVSRHSNRVPFTKSVSDNIGPVKTPGLIHRSVRVGQLWPHAKGRASAKSGGRALTCILVV